MQISIWKTEDLIGSLKGCQDPRICGPHFENCSTRLWLLFKNETWWLARNSDKILFVAFLLICILFLFLVLPVFFLCNTTCILAAFLLGLRHRHGLTYSFLKVLNSFLGPTVHREVGSLSALARICFFPVVGVEVGLFILTVKCPLGQCNKIVILPGISQFWHLLYSC